MVIQQRVYGLLVSLLWLFSCSLAQGQGFFLFSNFRPTEGIDAPIFDAEGNRLRGTDYAAALYVGGTFDELEITVNDNTGELAILHFRDTDLTAGYIAAVGSDSQVVARNVDGGTLVWVQVRAWYVPLGETYEEAQQRGLGGYGESPAFQLRSGLTGGAGTDFAPLIGLESFSLRPVIPEPGTLSLLLMALPVLWLTGCRRRNHSARDDA